MTFLAPWALLGLLAVPVLAAVYLWVVRRRGSRRPAAFELTAENGVPARLRRRRHIPAVLFLAALGLLLFSFARPEMQITVPTLTGKVILAFDTSNSMVADDVAPTRLDVAKKLSLEFADRQPRSVQLGVVAFTNGGLVVQQPTTSRRDVERAIERLAADGGTSISEGIFASLTAISDEPIELDSDVVAVDISALDIGYFSNAAIVVFTDGEDVVGADPIELAGLAANAGVPIYTVGIGTQRGTVVPLDGFSIATALDEPMLTEIASSTGGAYFRALDDPDLTAIFDALDRRFERHGERVEVTALVGLVAMILMLTAGGLSLRWFGRVP